MGEWLQAVLVGSSHHNICKLFALLQLSQGNSILS